MQKAADAAPISASMSTEGFHPGYAKTLNVVKRSVAKGEGTSTLLLAKIMRSIAALSVITITAGERTGHANPGLNHTCAALLGRRCKHPSEGNASCLVCRMTLSVFGTLCASVTTGYAKSVALFAYNSGRLISRLGK